MYICIIQCTQTYSPRNIIDVVLKSKNVLLSKSRTRNVHFASRNFLAKGREPFFGRREGVGNPSRFKAIS